MPAGSKRSLRCASALTDADRFCRRAKATGCGTRFSYIVEQRGMFSFSGLTDEAVEWLKQEKSIYIVKGGRINVAGLTSANIDYVCDAVAEVLNK